MTPKERARKIIKELEADARKRETPRLSFDDTADQIECAIYAAILEEREAIIRGIVEDLDYKHGVYNAAIRNACKHIDERVRARTEAG